MAVRFYTHRIVGSYPEIIKTNLDRIKAYLDKCYLKDTSTIKILHALAFVQKHDFSMDLDGDYKYRFGSDFSKMTLEDIDDIKQEIDDVIDILSLSDMVSHYEDNKGEKFTLDELEEVSYTDYDEDEDGNLINSYSRKKLVSPNGDTVTPIKVKDRKYSV